MTDDVKKNLEDANNVLAKKMNANLDADELKKLAEGVATTAKAMSEIEDIEERRNADFDKDILNDERATRGEKLELWKMCVETGANIAGGLIKGISLVGLFIIASNQKHDETESYVTSPKTNNFLIDGFKNLIRK